MRLQKPYHFITCVCATLILYSCNVDNPLYEDDDMLNIPAGFSYPEIPADNMLTAEKISLGKKLFYDKALSTDYSISCASCHKQEFAFGDDVAISEGVEGRLGFRNSPSLANIAYAPVMLKDGGNPSLETQPYVPLETHFEMDFNMVLLVERLKNDPVYVQEFKTVFGKDIDPFGITRALAAFERTLISGNSNYDQYQFQNNKAALNASEINGMNLFFSDELNCASCHGGFLFTDNTFQNNGYFDDYTADSGRARITWLHDDVGLFRVPSLRNIALTAPYMHDGSVATLSELIDRYMLGGSGHENQSEKIRQFNLTLTEKNDLINFLHALTDETFITNPEFKDE